MTLKARVAKQAEGADKSFHPDSVEAGRIDALLRRVGGNDE